MEGIKVKRGKKFQRVEFDSLINLQAKIPWKGGKEGEKHTHTQKMQNL